MNGDFNARWFARSQVLSHVSTIHFPAASKRNKKHFSLELDFFSLTTVWNLIIKTFYYRRSSWRTSKKVWSHSFCSHRLIATLTMRLYEHYMHFAARKILKFPSTGQNKVIDCSQCPIWPWDRRDITRLTIYGGHLDFQVVVFYTPARWQP